MSSAIPEFDSYCTSEKESDPALMALSDSGALPPKPGLIPPNTYPGSTKYHDPIKLAGLMGEYPSQIYRS